MQRILQIFMYSNSEILHQSLTEVDSVAYGCNVEKFAIYMKFISVSLNSC